MGSEDLDNLLQSYFNSSADTQNSKLRQCLQAAEPAQKYFLLKIPHSTAIHRAASRGDTETIRCMLDSLTSDQGYDLLTIDCNNITAMYHAAARGHTETIKCMLNHLTSDQKRDMLKYKFGVAIHRAADGGHTETVRYMLDLLAPDQRYEILRKATETITHAQNIHTMLVNGTSVHKLADRGHTETIKCMLDYLTPEQIYEILKTCEKDGGATAIHKAADRGHAETVKCMANYLTPGQRYDILKSRYGYGTAIYKAAAEGDTGIIESMLDGLTPVQRYSILKIDYGYGTPLHISAYKGHSQTAECMLNYLTLDERYDIMKVVYGSGTLIHRAAASGNSETIKCMLNSLTPAQRYDILKIPNDDRKMVLRLAVNRGAPEIIECILDMLTPEHQLELLESVNLNEEIGKTCARHLQTCRKKAEKAIKDKQIEDERIQKLANHPAIFGRMQSLEEALTQKVEELELVKTHHSHQLKELWQQNKCLNRQLEEQGATAIIAGVGPGADADATQTTPQVLNTRVTVLENKVEDLETMKSTERSTDDQPIMGTTHAVQDSDTTYLPQ